jgi:lipopolysaccharide biosynthesis glycosyltransferase
MKWFFGFNAETDWYVNYFRYIKCAVNSARQNTTLELHFLYDGGPGELTEYLTDRGVQVHFIRSRFYDFFMSLKSSGINANVACGAYLRAEIPDLMYSTDPFVLYTDCDVMFMGDVSGLQGMRPRHFACAPEFSQDNWSYFNSGVMLMNTVSMQRKMERFEKIVYGSRVQKLMKSYDQETYNEMYKGVWDRLPVVYNWKPYWGFNEGIKILHFHGLKVENIERALRGEELEPVLKRMWESNPVEYKKFYDLAIGYEGIL